MPLREVLLKCYPDNRIGPVYTAFVTKDDGTEVDGGAQTSPSEALGRLFWKNPELFNANTKVVYVKN